jgi:hypothetical protein
MSKNKKERIKFSEKVGSLEDALNPEKIRFNLLP